MQESYIKNKYSFEEVMHEALNYFEGDELAASTWLNKYAMRNVVGELLELSPDDMHRRMALEFERIEKKYNTSAKNEVYYSYLSDYAKKRQALDWEKIYQYFKKFKYIIPQGSVMTSLGNPFVIASLSNCVVLPEIHDSYGGIFYTDQQLAQLFKRRCGVGIDISTLRPSGQAVSNAALTTSGAVSFMERFSNTTREVAQNGRRGALMITMDIAHPDILEFIRIKQDLSKVTGANISVRISDEFMHAVKHKDEFVLRWPINSKKPEIERKITALSLWKEIIACAYNTAEPGIIFWDRQHNYSTSSVYPDFKNVSTNPCSEIAMQGGDSCRLMALNLFGFVEEAFTPNAKFNFDKFYEVSYEAQRLMDDLVDLELEALQRIIDKINTDLEPENIKQVELSTWKLLMETGKKGRRTGLGFTGLADALAALNLKFDSEGALLQTERIMKTKCEAEFTSSIDMAIERGSFQHFNAEIENSSQFIQELKRTFPVLYDRMMKYGRRNISISTVAPTGSISLLAQTSSGIEPVFSLHYKRRKRINAQSGQNTIDFVDNMGDKWTEYLVYHHKLKDWMKLNNMKDETLSPFYKSTAPEIDWKKRIEMQAIVQRFTTHSISSTINLPANTSMETVENIYFNAWEAGLKGITVYRDGSRAGVLIQEEKYNNLHLTDTVPPPRPAELEASIMRFMNQNEEWIAFIGLLNKRPYEIFTGRAIEAFDVPVWVSGGWIEKTKIGPDSRYDFHYLNNDGKRIIVEGLSKIFNQEYWNYAKLISGVLRHGMPLVQVTDLIEHLKLYPDTINTWKSGVERALKQFIPDGTPVGDKACPGCGDFDGLIYQEGCLACKSCGYAECG